MNACWNRSATSRRQRPKKGTIVNLQHPLRNLFYFNQTASAISGVIQYAGTSAAVSDVIGGHVTSLVTGTSSVLSAHRSGDLKILAVSASERLQELPDVPTYAESGLGDVKFSNNWYGIFAPAGTPGDIKQKIAAGFNKAAHSPDVQKVLKPLLLHPVGSSPAEFAAKLAEDQER
ncbi:MAG: hypothetical protein D1H97_19255, partial [Paracoccus sp. BP8]